MTVPMATADMAARLGVPVWALEVVHAEMATASTRRLVFRSCDGRPLEYQPGQDLMFTIPAGDAFVRRRYTIRSSDEADSTFAVDVVLHSNGPGSRWATSLQVGDTAEAIGPRGKITLADDVADHLFVGDESFVPAASAMAGAVEPGGVATLILMAEENLPGSSFVPSGAQVVRSEDELRAAVEHLLPLDAGTHSYIGGERLLVRAVESSLVEGGVDPSRISAKSYWRRDQANAAHGEPARD